MGPNSKRAQRAAASSANTPARARFSKPPSSGRGGRGGRAGRGRGNKQGGRGRGGGRGGRGSNGRGGGRGGDNVNKKKNGNSSASTDSRANVIKKISKRVVSRDSKTNGNSKSKHPLAGIDKSKLDEVTLSEELVQIVSKLLADLNVMQPTFEGRGDDTTMEGKGADTKTKSSNDDQSLINSMHSVEQLCRSDENQTEHSCTNDSLSEKVEQSSLFLHLTSQLSFSATHAQRACCAIQNWSLPNSSENSKKSKENNVSTTDDELRMGMAMDWLCLHLNEDDLKRGFRPNRKKKSSSKASISARSDSYRSIVRDAISVERPNGSDREWKNTVGRQERVLGFIRQGFNAVESDRACEEIADMTSSVDHPLDDDASVAFLLTVLEKEIIGQEVIFDSASMAAADMSYIASELEQELEALQAIFDGQIEIRSGRINRYILTIIPHDDLLAPARSEECKLHVFLRPGYPVFLPPLLLFSNPSFPPSLLRQINIAMIRQVHSCIGEPVVFDAVNFLCDSLGDMQRKFIEEQEAIEMMAKIDLDSKKNRKRNGPRALKRQSNNTTTIMKKKEERGEVGERISQEKGSGSESQETRVQSISNADKTTDFMNTLRQTVGSEQYKRDHGSYVLKSKNANESQTAGQHLPTPVAVATGDLANIIETVTKEQTEQPWLVSSEARAQDLDNERNDLSPEQQHEQRRVSKKLQNNLKGWHRAAEQWHKQGGKRGEKEFKMLSQRQRLPAFQMEEEIVRTIGSNQISVVSGDTGCGKTTQVPQLVLDSMIRQNRGSEANIIVTQPRRISAIGVAERIASERCERVGETVGYSIRLENKRSAKTRLLLCTTGILLRRLQCDPDLASVSHVFVDEVHERDINTDFLLIILKDLLRRRKGLKLILMSATLNADTFSTYFGGCPSVSIPGRTHPVQENRLEDILALTGHEIKEGSDYALKKKSHGTSPFSKSDLKRMYPNYDSKVISSLAIVDESIVNYELIAELLEHIVLYGEEGAILVFMPGMMEITKTIEELCKKGVFADESKTIIYPLHSSLSTAEQTAVFEVPPKGIRKVVVATNIAETSITIEDVVYVVDSARVKENRQDEKNQMMTLVECWVSRASAKQRRGRAGRVRPGISYHMYSSHTHKQTMLEYQLPEMLRVGLEDLVLQILLLDLGEPSIFLTKAVDPPTALAIRNSLKLLEGLGAVDCEWQDSDSASSEKGGDRDSGDQSCRTLLVTSGLTALGFHLATLPVDPRVGKMMIYGALFGCIDPALTIAASMSARNPFMSPFDKRDEADAARKKFATEGSDHLTTLTAFNQWKSIRGNKGNKAAQLFLRESFLSRMTLFQMEDLRKQFSKLLVDIGFLPKSFRLSDRKGGRGEGLREGHRSTEKPVNEFNIHLLKAVLCAGLYPNIIVASDDQKKPAGTSAFQSLKGDVFLHPSTISFGEKKIESRYCCYHEIVKTSKTYARDATPVSKFALLLFGGNLKVYHAQGVITIDDWLKFRIAAKPATLVKHLRAQMENLLLRKIISPEEDIIESPEGKALIQAISTLFEKESNDE